MSRPPRAAVSNFQDAASRADSIATRRLLSDVDEGRRQFARRDKELDAQRAEVARAAADAQRLAGERSTLQRLANGADTQDSSLAERLARAESVKAALARSEAAVAAQREHVARLEAGVLRAEVSILDLEVSLSKRVEVLEEARGAEGRRQEAVKGVASARVARDARATAALADGLSSTARARMDAVQSASTHAEVEHARARVRHAHASTVLATSAGEREAVREAAAELAASAMDKRMAGVMALKHSLEDVEAATAASNARRAAAEAAEAAAHEEEYSSLLAARRNPYEVWRARSRDASFERTQSEHAVKVSGEQARVLAEIRHEDELKRPGIEAARVAAREEATRRKAHLPAVKAAIDTAYIMSVTRDGRGVLDPAGTALVVQPSALTSLKPLGFGLGHTACSRPEVVAALAGRPGNEGVAPLRQWLPKEDDSGGAGEEEGEGEVEDPLASPRKKYELRALSVYEARMMEEALGRQRRSMVGTQTVGGKTYGGVGFATLPPTLDFTDFTVGVPFSLTLSLTNVSLTFNSWKLLPMHPSIRDLFVVNYVHPGRMSAGTSLPVTVTFTPRSNEDIRSSLDLLAATGPVSIPLSCTSRKALPLVRAPSIDVGRVTCGESAAAFFTIENEGVLPVSVHVSRLPAEWEGEGKEEGKEEGSGLLPSPWSAPGEGEVRTLPGYGSVRVPIRFAPRAAGPSSLPLRLAFVCAETEEPIPPLHVLARGSGQDVPLYVEADVIDLRTCLHGKLYRASLVLRNRGSVTLKCSPSLGALSAALGEEVQFHPSLGFVQARDAKTSVPGTFTFQVLFRPSEAMLARAGVAELLREEGGEGSDAGAAALAPRFSLPLSVSAPDQVLPVLFTLTARLSPSALVFEPESLDLGSVAVGQAASASVSLTNASALPQKYGFPALPTGWRVSPGEGDGFGLLLPGEAVALYVVYVPPVAGPFEGALTCLSTTVGTHRLRVRGVGTVPPLSLSHPCLLLAATAVGEVETAYVHLHNGGGAPMEFHVMPGVGGLPGRPSPVIVTPTIGTLPVGGTVRMQLTYTPTREYYEAGLAAQGREVEVHEAFSVPIFYRPAAGKAAAPGRTPPLQSACLLSVAATIVPRLLLLDAHAIVFGAAPVGRGAERAVRVTNGSPVSLDLVPGALNPIGAFSLVNAPRTLAPGAFLDLIVRFKPDRHAAFTDRLTLGARGHGPLAFVTLTGEGVSPTLSLLAPPGGVDFGSVVVGDSSRRSVTLSNTSVFPLSFSLGLEGGLGGAEGSPVPLFTASPASGSIPAGGMVKIVLEYSPRHAPPGGLPHTSVFRVDTPNGDEMDVKRVPVVGRAWDRSIYVLPSLLSEEVGRGSAGAVDSILAGGESSEGADGGELYTLVFPKGGAPPPPAAAASPIKSAPGKGGGPGGGVVGSAGPPSAVKELLVFCIDPAGYVEAPAAPAPTPAALGKPVPGAPSPPPAATFDVSFPPLMEKGNGPARPHAFSVEATSGTVPPGGKVPIRFRFNPPAPATAGGKHAPLVVGEWQEVDVTVVLRGGVLAPGARQTHNITVRLRGYASG